METGLVHGAVCLFAPQFFPVLIAPTHGGIIGFGWLYCEMVSPQTVTHPGTNLA